MMNPNGEPTFNNISGNNQTTVPAVVQPVQAGTPAIIKFTKEYLFSLTGVLRLLIIVCQFCAWVSAAAVPVLVSGAYYMPVDFAQTRSAYLFFSIIGFLFGIVIFVAYLMNIVNLNRLNKIPWHLILLVLDTIWFISMFILAIVCSVKEGAIKQAPNLAYANEGYLNIGAFGSAAFFGFVLAIFYGILAGLAIIKVVKGGVSRPSNQ